MPLASENPGLVRRALSATRAGVQHFASPFDRPGPPIETTPISSGEYTPALAATRAVINFAAGVRGAANYRAALARQRADAAYREAQTEHTRAQTYALQNPKPGQPRFDYTTSGGEVLKDLTGGEYATQYRFEHPPARGLTPYEEQSISLRTRAEDRLANVYGRGGAAETDRTARLRLSALRAQEQGVDTEENRLAASAETTARQVADAVTSSAMLGDATALRALGIGGDEFRNLTPEAKMLNIRAAGERYRVGLASQYRGQALERTLAKRRALGTELSKYSGFEFPAEETADPLELLLGGP